MAIKKLYLRETVGSIHNLNWGKLVKWWSSIILGVGTSREGKEINERGTEGV